jgi:hypothetical protein
VIAGVAILAFLAWLFPGSREIDVTLTATEYRLDDPDFAVEHTVTIRGRDSRTRFGNGTFKGTISISGIEGMEEEREILASLGEHPIASGPHSDSRFFPLSVLIPNWDYTAFVGLLGELQSDGAVVIGGKHARFLVRGLADREKALVVATEVSNETYYEDFFCSNLDAQNADTDAEHTRELREQYHRERSEYIFRRFNMNPEDYCYARDYDALRFLDTKLYLFMRETMDVPPESTTPAFFLTEDTTIVYVAIQDNTALNHLYEFTLSEDGNSYTAKHSSNQDTGRYQDIFESFSEYKERVGLNSVEVDE